MLPSPIITKRLLGCLLAAVGFTAVVGLLLIDFVRQTDFQGIGPAQQAGLIVGGVLFLLGLTLIPLGNRPA